MSHVEPGPASGEAPGLASAAVLAGCYVVSAVLGVLVALLGAFLVPARFTDVRLVAGAPFLAVVPGGAGGLLGVVTVGVVVAVVGLPALILWLTRGVGRRGVGVLVLVCWLLVEVRLSLQRPEGDLVLTGGGPGSAASLLQLFGGAVAGAAAVGLGRAGRMRAARDGGRQAGGVRHASSAAGWRR